MADQPDAHELWTRDCLAKAAFCEFTLDVVVDGGLPRMVAEVDGRMETSS